MLPNAELRALQGISHNVKMSVLAPVLAEFFTAAPEATAPGKAGPVPA